MGKEEPYFEKEKPDFEDTYNGFRLQGHYFAPLEKESGKGYRVDALKDDDAFSVMGIVKPIEMAKKDYREEEAAEKDWEMVKKQMQEQTRAEVEERIDEGNYEDHEFKITLLNRGRSMSSDGPGREDDQARDDEKRNGDKRSRQKKITFQDLFGISPEEIRRASEKLAMAGEQLREAFPNESFVLPNERFKEIQKQQAVFAHEIAQAHARFAPALQELAHGTNEAQRIGDAIAKGLLTLGADMDALFPSQDVLAAALAQGYRQAQQSEPAIEDDEQALAFLVAMASTAWEQLKEKGYFLSEAVNPPSEEDFIKLVVALTLLIADETVGLSGNVAVHVICILFVLPQLKDRFKS